MLDVLLAFSNMIVSVGKDLLEAEINPLFVLPKGQGVKAADGVVAMKAADQAE